VIFDQGFLPVAHDAPVSNCKAAVLVLVRPGYFISPVPAISDEPPGEAPDGRLAITLHYNGMDMFKEWKREDFQKKL